jgi:hypothetical protein
MAMSKEAKQKLLDKMRKNQNSSQRDPTEWRPKFKKEETISYKAYVLPPIMEGDTCLDKNGNKITASSDWDVWYVQNGHHFINKRRYQCPRVHGTGECAMCDAGFELMRDVDDKETRSAIAKEWLSQESHAVNLYFPDVKDNPEDVRGKVLWWNLPNKIFKMGKNCVDRSDPGPDEDDPQPYGLFFMPDEALMFKIELKEKSGYNNYDDSKMFVKPKPIASDDDEIQEILDRRSDIRLKFDKPDPDALTKIVEEKLAGSVDESGFSEDHVSEDHVSESKAQKASGDSEEEEESKSKHKPKAEQKKAKPEPEPESDDDDMDDEMKALLDQIEG